MNLTKLSLSEINKPIEDELEVFTNYFKDSLKSQVKIINFITKFILSQKGKKIRPTLVLHSANVCGGITERTYVGASLVELLHTATLVHDDVIDEADKRRGFPSLNNIWKNKVGVLMGDYLLASGLMISVENEAFDFLKEITLAVKKMSEGELLQINKSRKLDITEEIYFDIIEAKTASLIETCCVIGGLSVTNDSKSIESLRKYGKNLGMAFQIQDDILDFVGKSSLFGKNIGADIKERKITLPLIYSLNTASKPEKDYYLKLIRKKNKENKSIIEIIDFIQKQKGIEYATQKAEEFLNQAELAISDFPNSPSKVSLINLLDYVITRSK